MKNSILKIGLLMTSMALLASACTAKKMDKDATTPDKAENYTLAREWKKVVRYNCEGEVTSDKIETVTPPTRFVSITPKILTNFHNGRFENLRNSTGNGLTVSGYKFTIDMAPTLLNLKVEEGLNQIRYSFYYCDEYKLNEKGEKTAECTHTPDIREQGNLYINVTYTQKWLDGFNEVKLSVEQCEREKETKSQKPEKPQKSTNSSKE